MRRVRSVRRRASPSLSSSCMAELCAVAMWLRKSTSFRAAEDAPVQLIPCLTFSCTVHHKRTFRQIRLTSTQTYSCCTL